MKGLKIGFDGKRAVANYTGIGNYSRLALQSILDIAPHNELLLYTPSARSNDRLDPMLAAWPQLRLRTPDTVAGRAFGALWRSRGLTRQLRREGVDLYHGLSNELPVGIGRSGIPSVVTIHDVIFRRHPEFYHRADVSICDRKFGYAARAATRIIAISERTRADICEFYGVDPSKIDVVYQGCADLFHKPVSPESIRDVRARYSLPDAYIVGVGTVESRKNQKLAVRALASLPRDLGLVLVGRRTAYARRLDETVSRLGLDGRVMFIENAPMADIPALYAGAVMVSYPSFYEGFGLPVIEAIAAGTPVVAATGSCLEEAGGPGALYVDPRDDEAFADAARRLLDDSSLRRHTVAMGRDHITRFRAGNFGQGLIDVYLKTLNQ